MNPKIKNARFAKKSIIPYMENLDEIYYFDSPISPSGRNINNHRDYIIPKHYIYYLIELTLIEVFERDVVSLMGLYKSNPSSLTPDDFFNDPLLRYNNIGMFSVGEHPIYPTSEKIGNISQYGSTRKIKRVVDDNGQCFYKAVSPYNSRFLYENYVDIYNGVVSRDDKCPLVEYKDVFGFDEKYTMISIEDAMFNLYKFIKAELEYQSSSIIGVSDKSPLPNVINKINRIVELLQINENIATSLIKMVEAAYNTKYYDFKDAVLSIDIPEVYSDKLSNSNVEIINTSDIPIDELALNPSLVYSNFIDCLNHIKHPCKIIPLKTPIKRYPKQNIPNCVSLGSNDSTITHFIERFTLVFTDKDDVLNFCESLVMPSYMHAIGENLLRNQCNSSDVGITVNCINNKAKVIDKNMNEALTNTNIKISGRKSLLDHEYVGMMLLQNVSYVGDVVSNDNKIYPDDVNEFVDYLFVDIEKTASFIINNEIDTDIIIKTKHGVLRDFKRTISMKDNVIIKYDGKNRYFDMTMGNYIKFKPQEVDCVKEVFKEFMIKYEEGLPDIPNKLVYPFTADDCDSSSSHKCNYPANILEVIIPMDNSLDSSKFRKLMNMSKLLHGGVQHLVLCPYVKESEGLTNFVNEILSR